MSRKRQGQSSGKPLTERQIKWLLGEVSEIAWLCPSFCPFKDGDEMREAWFANRTMLLRRAKGKFIWPMRDYESDFPERSRARIQAALKRMEKKRQTE